MERMEREGEGDKMKTIHQSNFISVRSVQLEMLYRWLTNY